MSTALRWTSLVYTTAVLLSDAASLHPHFGPHHQPVSSGTNNAVYANWQHRVPLTYGRSPPAGRVNAVKYVVPQPPRRDMLAPITDTPRIRYETKEIRYKPPVTMYLFYNSPESMRNQHRHPTSPAKIRTTTTTKTTTTTTTPTTTTPTTTTPTTTTTATTSPRWVPTIAPAPRPRHRNNETNSNNEFTEHLVFRNEGDSIRAQQNHRRLSPSAHTRTQPHNSARKLRRNLNRWTKRWDRLVMQRRNQSQRKKYIPVGIPIDKFPNNRMWGFNQIGSRRRTSEPTTRTTTPSTTPRTTIEPLKVPAGPNVYTMPHMSVGGQYLAYSVASWSPWSSWFDCIDGHRIRVRGCFLGSTGARCMGPNKEVQPCHKGRGVHVRLLHTRSDDAVEIALRQFGLTQEWFT